MQVLIDDIENKHHPQSEQATVGYKHPVLAYTIESLWCIYNAMIMQLHANMCVCVYTIAVSIML
jgi:hypothetical protein